MICLWKLRLKIQMELTKALHTFTMLQAPCTGQPKWVPESQPPSRQGSIIPGEGTEAKHLAIETKERESIGLPRFQRKSRIARTALHSVEASQAPSHGNPDQKSAQSNSQKSTNKAIAAESQLVKRYRKTTSKLTRLILSAGIMAPVVSAIFLWYMVVILTVKSKYSDDWEQENRHYDWRLDIGMYTGIVANSYLQFYAQRL